MDAIKQFASLHPENRDLILQRAYAEVIDRSPEIATAAVARIHDVATLSKHYVRLLLEISVTLASYHKFNDSVRVFRLIDHSNVNLDDFAAFHTLGAWHAISRGEMNEAVTSLNRALEMNPKQISANWLKAVIAKRQDDAQAGVIALNNLFDGDPYNENYVSLILHFRNRSETPSFERLFREISIRQAYYGDLTRQRIRESRKSGKSDGRRN